MKFSDFLDGCLLIDANDKSVVDKDVIVIVDGLRLPFPDVVSVEANEDTIEIHAKVIQPT